jgi:hypothetical protein
MSAIEDETKEGFNAFLTDQRAESGTATVSLYEFDSTVELVYQNRLIEDAPVLDADNYSPGGSTALHDALSRAVAETSELIDAVAAPEQPENTIVVVLTDGKENASDTTAPEVREQVEHRRDGQEWEFLFIGANQDAALTAEEMGMDESKSLNMAHDGEGTRDAYRSTSESISRARQEGETGGFTEEDRRRQDTSDQSDSST